MLTHDDVDSGQIVCPSMLSDNAYFANYVEESWVLLDFIAPEVRSWSLGFLYNVDANIHSQMSLGWNGRTLRVEHVNYKEGGVDDGRVEYVPDGLIENDAIGKVRLEFETTSRGSTLRLNGEKVMHVPSAHVSRQPGGVALCIGLYGGETEPYTIRFSDLWAWAE